MFQLQPSIQLSVTMQLTSATAHGTEHSEPTESATLIININNQYYFKPMHANFFCKSQIVNILGFVGHTVSVPTTRFCPIMHKQP